MLPWGFINQPWCLSLSFCIDWPSSSSPVGAPPHYSISHFLSPVSWCSPLNLPHTNMCSLYTFLGLVLLWDWFSWLFSIWTFWIVILCQLHTKILSCYAGFFLTWLCPVLCGRGPVCQLFLSKLNPIQKVLSCECVSCRVLPLFSSSCQVLRWSFLPIWSCCCAGW